MTKMSLKIDENNFKKKKGVNKNYFWILLSGNILDLDIHNIFLNSGNIYP